jgi:hypothetical protein
MNAIITHGSLPGTATLVDEPSLLVQSLTITPQRTEARFKGPNRATQGLTYTDPVLDFAFNAIITGTGELATGGPGQLLLDIANFAAITHGFDPEDGILVFRDPSDAKDTDNPDTTTFTVTHFPFVPKSFATAIIGTGNAALLVTAKVHGPTGNALTIATALNNTDARTALTVTNTSGAILVTSGDKRVMRVTGTLTSDGSTPSVFPDLPFDQISNGKPAYEVAPNDVDIEYLILWDNSPSAEKWTLIDYVTSAQWRSTEDVATPDLVTTWTPVSPATGTPTVTAAAATASQVLTLINATTALPLAAALAPGSSGANAIAAAGPTPLTGG